MTITLDQPQLPYDLNNYYKEFVQGLADGGVWDKNRAAIPYSRPSLGPALTSVTAATTMGGLLTAGTYYYVMTAKLPQGETLVSREVSVVIAGPDNSTQIVWAAYPGAISYAIYRSTVSGDYRNKLVITATGTTYTDLGSEVQPGIPVAQQLRVTGTVAPPDVYTVKLMIRNGTGQFATVAEKTTNPDGTFEFFTSVARGSNAIKVLRGAIESQTIYVNAYNLHLYFQMMAEELKTHWQEIVERVYASTHLYSGQDLFDGNSRVALPVDLQRFWQVMTSVLRPSQYTDAEFRALLIIAIQAYKRATSFGAIKDIIQAIFPTWNTKYYIPGDVYSSGFRLGRNLKFDVDRPVPANKSLDLKWTTGNRVFGNERGYIKAGTHTFASVPATSRIFIAYLDGTRDVDGYFNVIIVAGIKTSLMPQTSVPEGAMVLALIRIEDDDIIHISGQGRLNVPLSSWYMGLESGPFLIGEEYITDGARMRSRGYKYSRFFIYLKGLDPFGDPDAETKVAMLRAILKEVKPAKMTIALGVPPSIHYFEI